MIGRLPAMKPGNRPLGERRGQPCHRPVVESATTYAERAKRASMPSLAPWMIGHTMNVQLSPAHQKWLAEQVSAGAFRSIDDAVAWAIEGVIHIAGDEMDWARPLIKEAECSLARGEGVSGDDFLAWLDNRLDALR